MVNRFDVVKHIPLRLGQQTRAKLRETQATKNGYRVSQRADLHNG